MSKLQKQGALCCHIMLKMNELRLAGAYCDTVLLVSGHTLPVHRLVLAATSKYFKNVFDTNPESAAFELNWVAVGDLVQLLDFIYTGQLALKPASCARFRDIAEQLEMSILKEMCDAVSPIVVLAKPKTAQNSEINLLDDNGVQTKASPQTSASPQKFNSIHLKEKMKNERTDNHSEDEEDSSIAHDVSQSAEAEATEAMATDDAMEANSADQSAAAVEYTLVPRATLRDMDMLKDSLGYCYTRKVDKRRSKEPEKWVCVNRYLPCYGTVIVRDGAFIRGGKDHSCQPNPDRVLETRSTARERLSDSAQVVFVDEDSNDIDADSDPEKGSSEVAADVNKASTVASPNTKPSSQGDESNLTFRILPAGSRRARDKLADSLGYTYTVKRRRNNTVYWECSVRPHTGYRCTASVIERNGMLKRGNNKHCHLPKEGAMDVSKRRLRRLKQEAKAANVATATAVKLHRPSAPCVQSVVRPEVNKISYVSPSNTTFTSRVVPVTQKVEVLPAQEGATTEPLSHEQIQRILQQDGSIGNHDYVIVYQNE